MESLDISWPIFENKSSPLSTRDMDDELNELIGLQSELPSLRLSDLNCVEIVSKLVSLGKINVFLARDGHGYVTRDKLEENIISELRDAEGVDMTHIEGVVKEICRKDKGKNLQGGFFVSGDHFRAIAVQIAEEIGRKHVVELSVMAERFGLSIEEIGETVIRPFLGTILNCEFDFGVLYTKAYAARLECVIRGILEGATRQIGIGEVLKLLRSADVPVVHVDIVEKIMRSNSFLGLDGELSRLMFTPRRLRLLDEEYVLDEFRKNGFVEFLFCEKAGISDARGFMATHAQGTALSTAFIGLSWVECFESAIIDADRSSGYVEASSVLPVVEFNVEDVQLLCESVDAEMSPAGSIQPLRVNDWTLDPPIDSLLTRERSFFSNGRVVCSVGFVNRLLQESLVLWCESVEMGAECQMEKAQVGRNTQLGTLDSFVRKVVRREGSIRFAKELQALISGRIMCVGAAYEMHEKEMVPVIQDSETRALEDTKVSERRSAAIRSATRNVQLLAQRLEVFRVGIATVEEQARATGLTHGPLASTMERVLLSAYAPALVELILCVICLREGVDHSLLEWKCAKLERTMDLPSTVMKSMSERLEFAKSLPRMWNAHVMALISSSELSLKIFLANLADPVWAIGWKKVDKRLLRSVVFHRKNEIAMMTDPGLDVKVERAFLVSSGAFVPIHLTHEWCGSPDWLGTFLSPAIRAVIGKFEIDDLDA